MDDVMVYDVHTNKKDLEKNIILQLYTRDLQEKVKEVFKDYWDVFCEDELFWPIQGFSFHTDTGKQPPICCKPFRYGPHEYEVMRKLVKCMDANSVVEEDG